MAGAGDPRRVAMVSVHTSPLEQPGTGDAGGLNVYVAETARELAVRGVEVDVFTRRTSGDVPVTVELVPGVTVRHVTAGPYEGLSKNDLPGQLCAFSAGTMHAGLAVPEDHYDVVHSHYWLSGQVGWLVADRWRVALVHTMHTMARVKNRLLAEGDTPEPRGREIGEAQVVEAADRLVANTDDEARDLVELYGADPAAVSVVPPGVDLTTFRPGDRTAARRALGVPDDDELLLFVGRIQPLKAPDVLLRAAHEIVRRDPSRGARLRVAVLGGPSGSGLDRPTELVDLARGLGIADLVHFVPPVGRAELAQWYRAADLVVVPSRSESFGLVAVEALACGTPVVAADVGGLPTAVGDAGVLVRGHDPAVWASSLDDLLANDARRETLSRTAIEHASRFGWGATTDRLLAVYRDAMARYAAGLRGGPSALADAGTGSRP
ncbi:D-inositol-3-phosphate glycosyltransferase [Terracoccus luteus]|uniref:D-inositol-3-phosphate glycosyltransferase n=1 Tax=Terracoccus luteus TaxID=53356 RepID=A0A839PXJ8_9MICO|nr:D-inositol-3-phosphate glycosyltransferase [Terracoccus luteus]MBB2986755.1 D-inositol-3-phosphate glycosyltransferase [Terracoccus luteus]MCP2172406.1 D-inositol-3-phosphate glycosyltransferase [Terracoccus luteus]